jgi:hypothetical protein
MTDQTTIAQEAPTDDEDEGGAYDLALFMKQRCAGFAYMLENTAGIIADISSEDMEGIAQIAKDIAEKAVELFERVRLEAMKADQSQKEA